VAKTPVSDEELQLKKKARRRLVGAIVLVLLVVVFVPMFLDREPRPQKQDMDIRIPPIPGQPQSPQPQVLPPSAPQPSAAAPPAAASDQPAAAPAESAAKDSVASSSASPVPTPVQDTSEPAPKAAKPTGKPESAAVDPGRKDARNAEPFVIQVGAFSDPANARHLVEKLKAEKIPAYTEPVKTAQGEKTRVRAGPYPTLTAAENGRSRLKSLKLLPGGADAKIVHKGE
jgi:DedD protein